MTASKDERYMAIAIEEAKKGLGRTSPNPCVGAVVVCDDQLISTGYHQKAGTPHAEVYALRRAADQAKGATIYVTLEPCSHTGRTPPCCERIVACGIRRVVVGMVDPNPLVSGSGNDFLRSHGIEVLSGVLEQECRALNRPFIKHITTALPWVVMKAGISLDGRISYQKGVPGQITGPESLAFVHKLRHRLDAILVGSKTVLADDPSLTTRLPDSEGCDPVRVVLDTHLAASGSARIFHQDSQAPTLVFCGPDVPASRRRSLQDVGAKVVPVGLDGVGLLDLLEVLKILGKEDVTSLLVEGGGRIHAAFLENRLVDHVNLFYAPIFAGNQGVSVVDGLDIRSRQKAIHLVDVHCRRFGRDLMVEGEVSYGDQSERT